MSIKDLAQIITLTKQTFGSSETIFNLGSPFCIEISLKTAENQTMILETWCILFNEQLCDSTQQICYSVYKKMSLVLRSLLCMTRTMPTYLLSRRQSPETYVLLYRMYCGEPIVHNLGEKYATAKAGTVGTPVGSIMINVAYRTRLTMTPQNSNLDAIMIKDDHFSGQTFPEEEEVEVSPTKHYNNANNNEYQLPSLSHPLSSLNENSKRSSLPITMKQKQKNDNFESPTQNDESSDDCSRNSSVASTPSDTMYYFKLKSAAFAPSSLNTNKELTSASQINEIPPFIGLLCNDMSPTLATAGGNFTKKGIQSPPPQNIERDKSAFDLNTQNYEEIEKKATTDTKKHVNKQLILQPKQDDFVLIETVSKHY